MTANSPETPIELEIELPISRPLKQNEKEEILRDLNTKLSNITPLKLNPGGYRERHGTGLPVEMIVNVTTIVANVIQVIVAVRALQVWLHRSGKEPAGINVKVDEQRYSIRNCRTADDVIKIMREMKRK